MAKRQVASGLLFYPRGGSSQVIRYLRKALAGVDWEVPLVVGSLGPEGEQSNARTFFGDDRIIPMDYTNAVAAYWEGRDPIAAPNPLHPSYEDRSGVPDRIFTAVSPTLHEHLEGAWRRVFRDGDLDGIDLFHLHHLTPQHAAVAQLWPDKPVVGHLHGTEMKMIQNIRERRQVARQVGTDLKGLAALNGDRAGLDMSALTDGQLSILSGTDWEKWRFGDFWEAKLREYVRLCMCLIVISPHDRDLARQLFPDHADRIEYVPNGVDTQIFNRRAFSTETTVDLLRQWLVDDPQGWDESGTPGTIRYTTDDIEQFIDPETGRMLPVLLYVGRFLNFKRVPLLIRAYQHARGYFDTPAPLIVWGGSPGEWEGEHPYTVAQAGGSEGIFLTGWRGHDDLPLGLNCVDLMVAPSHNEPFGQVYLEAMASNVPVIATRSGGPLSFVNTEVGRPNGWLIPPDDLEALAEAMIEAVNNPRERQQRADNAYDQIRRSYSWTSLAKRFERIYEREIDQAESSS